MLKALFIGDLHCDKLAKLFPDNHLQLQFNEVNKACTYAVKNGYEHVIFLGDIADKPRLSYEAQIAFIEFLSRWSKYLKLYFILGNHDFAENGVHSLEPFVAWQKHKFYKNITVFDKPRVVNIDGVDVNFSSFPATKSYKNCINVGHFEVSGSTGDNGRVIKKAVTVNKKHIWVMGHLHTPHTLGNVWYCGTSYQLSFGEKLPKGFMSVKAKMVDGKLKCKFKRHEVDPTFKLINLVVHSKSDLKEIEPNPNFKYRLLFKSKLGITDNMLSKYDNVVKVEGFSSKKELDSLLTDSFIEIDEQTIKLPSQKRMLKSFFSKKKMQKSDYKRAIELIGL